MFALFAENLNKFVQDNIKKRPCNFIQLTRKVQLRELGFMRMTWKYFI